MSKNEIELCSSLLVEHFGAFVRNVAKCLMSEGPSPLRVLLRHLNSSLSDVKKALKTLIQHRFVKVTLNDFGLIEYSIDIERVLLINRYPKYIYVAKLLYEDCGEHIVEELLKEGQLTISSTIERVVNRLTQTSSKEKCEKSPKFVYETFVRLAETRFVQRSCDVSTHSLEAQLNAEIDENREEKQFQIPKVKLNLITAKKDDETSSTPAKRTKLDLTQPDEGIYWTVNIGRFHQYLRDMMIIDAVKTHYDDERAVELVRTMFRLTETKMHPLSPTTTMLSKQEICNEALKNNICSSANQVDLYLKMFNDDVNYRFVSKCDESGGGMYAVNIFRIWDKLLHFTITSIVEDQFGSKTCRIFRLILMKKYLQQKQIEETAMIPSKDSKELTYLLFKEGFVKTLQYPKQPDYAPSRTCFVFTVDVPDLCRNLIQKCYRSLHNAIVRRNHEQQQHKSLLERKVFIDAVIANLQHESGGQDVEQQIKELNQSFSTHDKELLEKVHKLTTKLELSECQIDETLFLLQTWLLMSKA